MDNLTTGTPKKSTIHDQLLIMSGIVDSLTEAGVRIITAEATTTRQPNSLVTRHYDKTHDCLRRWAAENEIDLIVEPMEKDYKTGLNWEIHTEVNGVWIHGYLTDEEKEEYDRETLGD